jgi:hypothetical protein
VQFVFLLSVVTQSDAITFDLKDSSLFDPALLVPQKHPNRALFCAELIELSLQHWSRRSRALAAS